MGSLPDEDEPLLDKSRDGVVGREEEEADREDEEAEPACDSLNVISGVLEHGGHHNAHNCEDYKPREEKLRGPSDVNEIPPHQNPNLIQE